MKLDGCTALITGASAGIGREFARQLSGRAQTIVLVARREDRLKELRAELKSSVHVFSADLTRESEIARLGDWVEQGKIEIDLLINNAGFGDRGRFLTSEAEKTRGMLAVNVVALTGLTHRVLPAMVARGRGGILNVSSCASFLPMADFAVYAASKAYVTSFSEALRAELRGTGVVVTTLCPGPVHTEFGESATRPGNARNDAPSMVYVSAKKVAHLGLNALEQDRAMIIPGAAMKMAAALMRVTPLSLLRLAGRFYGTSNRTR